MEIMFESQSKGKTVDAGGQYDIGSMGEEYRFD